MTTLVRAETRYLRCSLLLRCSALIGILVLSVRRLIFITYPDFLPSQQGNPGSSIAMWAGVAVNCILLPTIVFTVMGAPLFLYLAIRAYSSKTQQRRLILDIALSLNLYVFAYFLVAPPR